MYQIDRVRLIPPIANETEQIRKAVAKRIRVDAKILTDVTIVKRSLDARKKPELKYSYTVAFDLPDKKTAQKLLKKDAKGQSEIRLYEPKDYPLPEAGICLNSESERPIVVGSGPAGLFCAYVLAKAGMRPKILERGKSVEERTKTVEAFWQGGVLDPDTNVQFGEGGAGTFSDGKLNTQVSDKTGLHTLVLRLFVEYGAPEDILYVNKPHIGTDVLKEVVKNLRTAMEQMGAEYFFETTFVRPLSRDNRICGAEIRTKDGRTEMWETKQLILCTGHSARDTFRNLYEAGIAMESKAFAVGYRVQHLQSRIDLSQYGEGFEKKKLPAADYKLTTRVSSGRGVYSFCMCPGGYVVNASSEEGRLAVNGMSYRDRGSKNANSAIVVTVDQGIFGNGLFDGMHFQERMEAQAYLAGHGCIPIERLADFRERRDDVSPNGIEPQIRGMWKYASLQGILPKALEEDVTEAFPAFGRMIEGFDDGDALLAGVESRTSSPIRIMRDANGHSSLLGLYPCGEGAGYAGGITSAAMDGIRTAERVLQRC